LEADHKEGEGSNSLAWIIFLDFEPKHILPAVPILDLVF